MTNLDSSKLKEFADDNFKFEENGRQFSKHVENAVAKGENAHDKQFLLFPQFLQMTLLKRHKNNGLVWKRVKKTFRRNEP